MKDEEYIFHQDVREKKVTGYSARKQKKHGKGGRVKLPSDYLTKKELKKMNGECISFRLNEPMTWNMFKATPEDIQITYIKAIQEKYNAPVGAIARMFGVCSESVFRLLRKNGCSAGSKGRRQWDAVGFSHWCYSTPVEETMAEEIAEILSEEVEPEAVEEVIPVAETENEDATAIQPCETDEDVSKKQKEHDRMMAFENRLKKSVPTAGSMTFEDKADNILLSLNSLLGNKKVCLHVEWTVVEE